jgi:hypothetical protein
MQSGEAITLPRKEIVMRDFNNLVMAVVNDQIIVVSTNELESIREDEKKGKWVDDMMSDSN